MHHRRHGLDWSSPCPLSVSWTSSGEFLCISRTSSSELLLLFLEIHDAQWLLLCHHVWFWIRYYNYESALFSKTTGLREDTHLKYERPKVLSMTRVKTSKTLNPMAHFRSFVVARLLVHIIWPHSRRTSLILSCCDMKKATLIWREAHLGEDSGGKSSLRRPSTKLVDSPSRIKLRSSMAQAMCISIASRRSSYYGCQLSVPSQ